MKYPIIFLGIVLVATAIAQTICTTTRASTETITTTVSTTSTYCPVCDAAKCTGGTYTTTYIMTFAALCPTGLIDSTYIVTNTCTGSSTINPHTIPPGFTTTIAICKPCPGSPAVTITTPVDAAVDEQASPKTPPGSLFYPSSITSNPVFTLPPAIDFLGNPSTSAPHATPTEGSDYGNNTNWSSAQATVVSAVSGSNPSFYIAWMELTAIVGGAWIYLLVLH